MKLKFILLPLLLCALVLCNGCLLFVAGGAAAVGAGTVVYVNGELKDSEAVTVDQAHAATLAAFKDLQFAVVGDESTPGKYIVRARTTTDRKVEVTLIKDSAKVTEIRIRVDTFGDEVLSRQVLDKIKAHL